MPKAVSDISIIIPAYNCAQTIIRALNSVFEQSDRAGEVIVVNDGSTDDTDTVIRNSIYFDKIIYHVQDNAGPSKARNKAISLATRAWCAFLDADDIWTDKSKLARQIDLVNAHPEATLIDSFARIDWHGQYVLTVDRIKNGHVFNDFLYANVINATSSVIAKTEIIKRIGGFDESIRFGEDRLLWAKLAKEGSVYTLPAITVFKVNEPGNLTSKGDKNYLHRVSLVHRLIELSTLTKNEIAKVWFYNVTEFFRLSFKVNDTESFIKVYADSFKRCGARLIFSRYSLLAIYGFLFRTFKPLN